MSYKTPRPNFSAMPTVEPPIEASDSEYPGVARLENEPEYLEVFWETALFSGSLPEQLFPLPA